MDPDMDDAMIRVKLADPNYYNRWIDVGYIEPLDSNQTNFKLVILDEYEGLVKGRVEELVFYFTGVADSPSSRIRPIAIPRNLADFKNLAVYTFRWMWGSVFLILSVTSLYGGELYLFTLFAALTASSIPLLDPFLDHKGIRYSFMMRVLTVVAVFVLGAIFR